MKNIVASVGLVALGASGFQTAQAQGLLGPDASKPWSVALSLRGFFDDNVNTAPNNPITYADGTVSEQTETFGYEISPSFKLGWSFTPQTSLLLGYTYTMKYYENRPQLDSDKVDQTHQFTAALEHRFSERFSANVSDSFVVGQEPDLLRATDTLNTFERVDGDNIRNYGKIGVMGQMTSTFGASVTYESAYYNYDSDEWSRTLDRLEHSIPIEGIFQLQPQTRLITGYRFRLVDYNSGLEIDPVNAPGVDSDIRNAMTHTGYIGLDHTLSQSLTASVRAGAQYSDYYNDDEADSEVTPYVKASLRYAYAEESFLEGGVTYDRSATDLVGFNGATFTTDAQTLVIYGSVTHRISSKIYGSLLAQFQSSDYSGGNFDNTKENFFLAGLNLEYRFNQNLSANAGYNFDRLDSDAGRSFSRNRVYVGVTARY